MTYMASFIVIGVNGLFHSDWLIGPQLRERERERWDNLATPPPPTH
jgi:hypothetical protein